MTSANMSYEQSQQPAIIVGGRCGVDMMSSEEEGYEMTYWSSDEGVSIEESCSMDWIEEEEGNDENNESTSGVSKVASHVLRNELENRLKYRATDEDISDIDEVVVSEEEFDCSMEADDVNTVITCDFDEVECKNELDNRAALIGTL